MLARFRVSICTAGLVAAMLLSQAASAEDASGLEGLELFFGLDGSKQPQDFGVNANLGPRLSAGYAAPLFDGSPLWMQFGTAVEYSDNAVRVYEVLGASRNRFQNHTTAGLFYRGDRWRYGMVYDHLYQDGFDVVHLGQVRGRVAHRVDDDTELGVTVRQSVRDDEARFLGRRVTLDSFNQYTAYWRETFETGNEVTLWGGVVGEHGESNVVTGDGKVQRASPVFGADIRCPLNDRLAIYGETNMTFPADSGTVDAYLGFMWYPGRTAKTRRWDSAAPLLPIASDPTFSVDLQP